MGIKIFDKHKLEKKLKKAKRVVEELCEETERQEEKIQRLCRRIGRHVVEDNIQIENEEIAQLRDVIINAKSKIQELQEMKKSADRDVYDIEENLAKIEGKIRCQKCGQIYERKENLLFCSKCGGSLETKTN